MMKNDEMSPADTSSDVAALLTQATGVAIAPERREIVAEFLREVREANERLRALDLEGVTPDAVFDPSWREDER